MNVLEVNSLVLAYIGDAIYEIYVRKYLVDLGINKVNNLQNEAKKYVSATNQARFLKNMIDNNFFVEEEMDVIKRARNSKINSHPKSTDILTYKHSTALEAVIGYLYLTDNNDKIVEIMKCIWSMKWL